jgi:hypothetical protein
VQILGPVRLLKLTTTNLAAMASLTNPLIGYVSAGTIGLQFQSTTGASNASDANFHEYF